MSTLFSDSNLPEEYSSPCPSPNFLHAESKCFTYAKLAIMTDDFKKPIGRGGFGMVYHGTQNDGSEVAVKLLSTTSNQGRKEFENEVCHQMIDFIDIILFICEINQNHLYNHKP